MAEFYLGASVVTMSWLTETLEQNRTEHFNVKSKGLQWK